MNFSDDFLLMARSPWPFLAGLLVCVGVTAVPNGRAFAQTPPPEECNEFAESINRNQVIMASFEAEIATFAANASAAETLDEITAAASQYVAALNQVTSSLTASADDLELLTLADSELQDYRDGYVAVLTGFNTALEIVNTAMSSVAIAETDADLLASLEAVEVDAATAIGQIESLAVDESNLIDEVNEYCGAE